MSHSSETRYATARLRRAAMRVLAHETTGAPATSENLAAASGRLLEKLSQRLGQVIGPAGVQAIFFRAVTLRKPEFVFLDERMVASDNRDGLGEPLRACLNGHEPEVIREVAVALFATFAGLLANVIGDRLTWSLLQQIWRTLSEPETTLPGDRRMIDGRGEVSIRTLATGIPGLDDVLGAMNMRSSLKAVTSVVRAGVLVMQPTNRIVDPGRPVPGASTS